MEAVLKIGSDGARVGGDGGRLRGLILAQTLKVIYII